MSEGKKEDEFENFKLEKYIKEFENKDDYGNTIWHRKRVIRILKDFKTQILRENELSLCKDCNCMTKKVCGKCKNKTKVK